MKEYIYKVEQDDNLVRLDKYLTKYSELTRSRVQQLIDEGNCEVNGKQEKANYKVKVGDDVILKEEEQVELGVIAQDITSWSEMKQVYRELKKPEVQNVFKAIIVDTIDIAADRCKKYICQQNGIEDLGDLGYGKYFAIVKEQ